MRKKQNVYRGGVRTSLYIALIVGVVFISPALAAESLGTLNGQLNDQNRRAAETSQRISDIGGQLERVQQQITDTQAQIAATNSAIADAKAQMQVHQAVLKELVQAEYKRSDTSSLELLASSRGFSDFVDREQYVQAGQDKIATTVAAINQLKKELDAKADGLAKLSTQLVDAQNGLNFARAQSQNQLAEIQAAQAQLKQKLAKYAGGQVVAAGDSVARGQLIGFEGTSGCSTGPHLHFEVQQNGTPINPVRFLGTRLANPMDPGYAVVQSFGPASWSGAPYTFHTGIDLSIYYGAPIYAAADGQVVFSGYDRSGFGDHVIIDHGGGLQTIYAHLGARGSDYPAC